MTYPVIDGQVATANINSSGFNMDSLPRRCNNLGWQVISVGFNTADAVVKLQNSEDNVNWEDIDGATMTIASGTASDVQSPVVDLGSTYYRAVYTNNTNSAGTLTVIFSFN